MIITGSFDSRDETANVDITKTNVKGLLSIGGRRTKYKNFELRQEYDKHHYITIELYHDVRGGKFIEDSAHHVEMIGRPLVLDIQPGDNNAEAYVFKGIVTNVRLVAQGGKNGCWIVEGASPTVMLERGKRMEIYSNRRLHTIFEEVVEGVFSNYLTCVKDPDYAPRITSLIQYNETDWEFLRRISYLYEENLFYSGSELLFGNYEEWEPELLIYNADIDKLEFSYKMFPNQGKFYQYVAEDDRYIEKKLPDSIESSNGLVNNVAEAGIPLTYNRPPHSQFEAPVNNLTEMSDIAEKIKSRNAGRTVVVKGETKSHLPAIGRLIRIEMPERFGGKRDYGTYRVIKAYHKIDDAGVYSNKFEAVPAVLKTMPVDEPRIPVAESLLGHVSKNDDPKGKGRVLVDFPFGSNYGRIWMRVMSPSAGGAPSSSSNYSTPNNQVAQNRGMVFVPEIGDQVMVGFEMGDPTRPYVMGSMFHGANGAGGGENNAVKSIITRSGHTIKLDDSIGSEKITISDRNQNIIELDTSTSSIRISAPENIDISAKNINLTAQEKISQQANNMETNVQENSTINVGDTMDVTANQAYSLQTTENSETINGNKEVDIANAYSVICSKIDVNATGGDIKMQSAGIALLQGETDAKVCKG